MTRRATLSTAAIVLIGLTAFLWRRNPAPDPALVEPRLMALIEPFTHVKSFYFYDGGSIGIEIKDAAGVVESFAIPSHLGDQKRYERVFVGADYDRRPGAVEVLYPEETKRALIRVLARYSKDDPALDWARYHLTGHPSDRMEVLWHTWTGRYPRLGGSLKRDYSSKP